MRDISRLSGPFRERAELVLEELREKHKLRMVPFYTARTPWEQARLWRQSRASGQINQTIEQLWNAEAGYLADVIDSVGPQYGRHVTNAIPGKSWHQWGEAIDCFLDKDGEAVWDYAHPGYQIYADTASRQGLVAGHFWNFRDSVHLQWRQGPPHHHYTIKTINEIVKSKWGKHEKDS